MQEKSAGESLHAGGHSHAAEQDGWVQKRGAGLDRRTADSGTKQRVTMCESLIIKAAMQRAAAATAQALTRASSMLEGRFHNTVLGSGAGGPGIVGDGHWQHTNLISFGQTLVGWWAHAHLEAVVCDAGKLGDAGVPLLRTAR